jgi:hypothetical protein
VTRIAAIPTAWGGQNYRSRLEAKYAVFMTALSWRFDYEAVDLETFRIPDFLMDFRHPTLIECKPAVTVVELNDYRHALIGKAADWLCADAERELRELDAAPDAHGDLARVDALLQHIDTVRETHNNSYVPGRRALVVGSRLFIEQQPDCVSIDGEHRFADGGDHVGLVDATGWCLVCGRTDREHRLMRSADLLAIWIGAGNKAQWRPPT